MVIAGEVNATPVDHVNGVELYWEQRGSAPRLLFFNQPLAAELGLQPELASDTSTLAAIFAGNIVPEGAEPLVHTPPREVGRRGPAMEDKDRDSPGRTVDPAGEHLASTGQRDHTTRWQRRRHGRPGRPLLERPGEAAHPLPRVAPPGIAGHPVVCHPVACHPVACHPMVRARGVRAAGTAWDAAYGGSSSGEDIPK